MKIEKLDDHTWYVSDNLYSIAREQHNKINELIDAVNMHLTDVACQGNEIEVLKQMIDKLEPKEKEEPEIKGCPFCGKLPNCERDIGSASHSDIWEIWCCNNECSVAPGTDLCDGRENAIKTWNKRA